MASGTRFASVMCVLIAGYVAAGSRLHAVDCMPSCAGSQICNQTSGQCFDVDLNCPAGGPIAQFDPDALGIATNELADGRYDASARANLLAVSRVARSQLVFRWAEIQPTSSASYNWEGADRQVNAMANANLDPVVILGWPPSWAADGCGRIAHEPGWRAFVQAVVARYGGTGTGRVRDWQFENEPNLEASPYTPFPPAGPLPACAPSTNPPYSPGPAAYASLLGIMRQEVLAVDSNARVWGPSVVWHVNNDGCGLSCSDWDALLDASPMQYLDAVLNVTVPDTVSIHIYESDPERMLDIYLAVVHSLSERTPPLRSIPIVVNEGHFGFGPGRSLDGCPYDSGQGVIAQDVANFYSCLLGTNASGAFWFNGNDRYTPIPHCSPDDGDNIRMTGLLGFSDNPNHPAETESSNGFEPARVKDALYVPRAIEEAQAARAAAPARLAVVPSTCRIETGIDCESTLLWTRRSPWVGALQVWRDGVRVPGACTAAGVDGQLAVRLTPTPATFELRATADCTGSAPAAALFDHVTARADANLEQRPRGAVFALDSPCFIPSGETACPMSLAWWSNDENSIAFPKVKVFAGGAKFLCVDKGTSGIVRTPDGSIRTEPMWPNAGGVLFRLYEAEGCRSQDTLGRLLAATRGRGVPTP